MELGPIQKQWLADMRANPERQISGTLGGIKKNGVIGMCCLGQLVVTTNNMDNIDYIIPNKICDTDSESRYKSYHNLEYTWKEYGLHDENGGFLNNHYYVEDTDGNISNYSCLAEMNDAGVSWLIIADFVEENPENVFATSL